MITTLTRWVAQLTGTERRNQDWQYFELLAGSSYAGPAVSEETSLRSTAVYACVRIIAESIASLPLVVFRQEGRNKRRATEHRLYPLLHDLANPEMTSMEWREYALSHAALWGNHWSEIELDDEGRAVALWPLRPDRMEAAFRRPDGVWWGYRMPDQSLRWIPAWRLHHIRGLGVDGVWGLSPIRVVAKQAVGLALATEEFGARFFSNGARPGLLLRHPGKLTPASFERLKRSFSDDFQGLSNAHRVKILEEGMDVTTLGIPPDEAQFLETRKFQVQEIARVFRVPPHMLADLDRATFSNIEHQSLEFVMHTLRPWLVRHEQTIYRDLLTPEERRNLFARYVVEGLLRGDTASRYAAYTTAINAGWLTRNEARELEDRNPIDGLDAPLVPLNMLTVGSAGAVDSPAPAQSNGARALEALEVWDARSNEIRSERQAVMTRMVRLFTESTERALRREVADIRRSMKAQLAKRSVEDFEAWLADFYREMLAWLPDYYRALMEAYAETIMAAVADELGGEPAPLDDGLREWILRYLDNFAAVYSMGHLKQLTAVIGEAQEAGEPVDELLGERLDGWLGSEPAKVGMDQAFEAGNALSVYGYAAAGVTRLRWSAIGESCPLCKRLDGRVIGIQGAFVDEGQTLEADGTAPLPIVRRMRHGPLHSGCDCTVIAA